MRCKVVLLLASFFLVTAVFSQQTTAPDPQAAQSPAPSKSEEKEQQKKAADRDAEAGESSSRETRIDVAPPKDDAKNHPNSPAGLNEASGDTTAPPSDVQEMHPWNPYRAVKDDEVGDFYFKQGNYKGAIARYEDALQYKEHDAVANFRLGQCYEKLDQRDQAIAHYKEYLKILPQGPFAKQAKKALEKLGEKQKRAAK